MKSSCINFANLAWWCVNALRFGTLFPTIKQVAPSDKKRLFVIGNGPSVNVDIAGLEDSLSREDVIMVNQALTSPLAFQIKPKYYVLMDPFYMGIYDEKAGIDFKSRVDALNEAFVKVDWEMYLFVSHIHYKKRINGRCIEVENNFIKICTFNALELYSFKSLQKFFYRHNFAIPSGINVLIAALSCGVVLGYKEIYLLGANSDWHKQLSVDSQNHLYTYDAHYYDGGVPEKVFSNYTVAFVFKNITQAFRAYEELGKMSFGITNCTSESMIDAFPRISLEKVLGGGGK
ncbi:hypothetical protein CQA49_00295 [Helicobacter sp. MIT 00-7814]|nr:hypothetical protein CQA49_00295 [Helicobacter sp. MIT 00-7814]RDU57784.1 hypothetical protein CQA37_00295 [Helicobacter sp. MIT 99-10781]